ncbi:MAG: LAGLIDADG family homing endonuclease [Actinomycetota bacterium]
MEVASSTLVASTQFLPSLLKAWRLIGFTLGGFVAGEGWFATKNRGETFKQDGTPRLRFVFGVTVATRDRPMLEALQCFLGCGSIWDYPPARPEWQPESSFEIQSAQLHREVTIPFAEAYLLPCHKRGQFEAWRDALYAYEERRPSQYGRGRSECSVPGCNKPVRGRMLCRSHYYRATGY